MDWLQELENTEIPDENMEDTFAFMIAEIKRQEKRMDELVQNISRYNEMVRLVTGSKEQEE